MSIFDAIFGNAKRIYAIQVNNIPLNQFDRQVKLTIAGETDYYKGERLRSVLASLVKNGMTLTKLEDELKSMGLKNDQIERRKEILSLFENKQ